MSQILSSSLVALAHGTNDAQKTMGVIVLTLIAGGYADAGSGVPVWVKVVCATAVALGTFSGGWRVIKTLGTKVTDIAPPQGFSAETSSSTTILASTYFGFSLSTTQVVAGGVMGTGLGKAGGKVHWNVVGRMVVAWCLTMPAAAAMGAIAEEGTSIFPSDTVGVVVVGIIAAIVLGYLFILSRRTAVTADSVLDDAPPDDGPAPVRPIPVSA